MKMRIKKELCKLMVTAAALLLLMMISAVVYGTLPLWAAVPAGAALLVAANAACGVLLADLPDAQQAAPAAPAARAVPLRAVRGGRAA